MIALGDAGHPAPDIDDDAGALMAEDRRKQPLGIGPGKGELVGVADPGRLDLDQHLTVFGAVELNRLDLQRLSGLESDSSACLHDPPPWVRVDASRINATALIAFGPARHKGAAKTRRVRESLFAPASR